MRYNIDMREKAKYRNMMDDKYAVVMNIEKPEAGYQDEKLLPAGCVGVMLVFDNDYNAFRHCGCAYDIAPYYEYDANAGEK